MMRKYFSMKRGGEYDEDAWVVGEAFSDVALRVEFIGVSLAEAVVAAFKDGAAGGEAEGFDESAGSAYIADGGFRDEDGLTDASGETFTCDFIVEFLRGAGDRVIEADAKGLTDFLNGFLSGFLDGFSGADGGVFYITEGFFSGVEGDGCDGACVSEEAGEWSHVFGHASKDGFSILDDPSFEGGVKEAIRAETVDDKTLAVFTSTIVFEEGAFTDAVDGSFDELV